MKKIVLFFVTLILFIGANFTQAQVSISTCENPNVIPDPSAILDVSGTTGGILIPRMTTDQRDQIPSPAIGLLIYNTDTQTFQYWNGIA
jgi:hypothetical protein